jgi:hypothetical protein
VHGLAQRLRPHFSLLSVGDLAISCSSCLRGGQRPHFSRRWRGRSRERYRRMWPSRLLFWRQAPPSSRGPTFGRLDSEDERLCGPPSLLCQVIIIPARSSLQGVAKNRVLDLFCAARNGAPEIMCRVERDVPESSKNGL